MQVSGNANEAKISLNENALLIEGFYQFPEISPFGVVGRPWFSRGKMCVSESKLGKCNRKFNLTLASGALWKSGLLGIIF